MKISKKIILATVVLPLVLSTSAFAAGGKDNKGGYEQCRPGLDRSIIKELSLTDSQKDQFKALRKANKEEQKDQHKSNPKQRKKAQEQKLKQINALLLADKFDPEKAKKLAQKMAEKQVKHQVNMLNKQYRMISILTPKQKAKFVELQEQRLSKCAENMPHGKNRK